MLCNNCTFVSLALVLLMSGSTARAEEHRASAGQEIIGNRIENFQLRDQRGKLRSLDEFRDHRLLVVAFLGTQCLLVKLYGSRLAQLSEKLKSRDVQFLAVNSNCQDSLVEVAAFARTHKLSFPVLKDPDNAVADRFGAVRTPEVFLLDQHRTVQYWGRIDDQYAIGVQRDRPRRRDLEIAIGELLAGKPVSKQIAESVGCHIGRVPKVKPHGEITYSNQIVGILRRHCVACHRQGQIAPFPLTEYHEVVGWATMIREVVDEGRMPPWFANPRHGEF